MSDKKLVKIVGGILQNAHDLAEWGLDTKHLTENDLRQIVLQRDPKLRREAAQKLIASGMSQRETAKILGISDRTVREDVGKGRAANAANSRTNAANSRTNAANGRGTSRKKHDAPKSGDDKKKLIDLLLQNSHTARELSLADCSGNHYDCSILKGRVTKELLDATCEVTKTWSKLTKHLSSLGRNVL